MEDEFDKLLQDSIDFIIVLLYLPIYIIIQIGRFLWKKMKYLKVWVYGDC